MDLLPRNMGATDRKIRIAMGAILCLLAIFSFLGAWAWIGIIPLATGFMNSCPVCTILDKNTLDK